MTRVRQRMYRKAHARRVEEEQKLVETLFGMYRSIFTFTDCIANNHFQSTAPPPLLQAALHAKRVIRPQV